MRKFLCIALILAISNLANADDKEMPVFDFDPVLYARLNWIKTADDQKRWVVDELLWGAKPNGKTDFWLFVYGPNFHQCNVAGVAEKIGRSKYQYTEDKCKLVFNFSSKGVVITDLNNACKELSCGSRAYLDGTNLSKATK